MWFHFEIKWSWESSGSIHFVKLGLPAFFAEAPIESSFLFSSLEACPDISEHDPEKVSRFDQLANRYVVGFFSEFAQKRRATPCPLCIRLRIGSKWQQTDPDLE
jgi:hypothetical protein